MKKKISHTHSRNNLYMALNCLFFLAASLWILFPIQQTAISQEVSFIITDSNNQSHGAADKWDYLFDDSAGSQVYKGDLSASTQTSSQLPTPTPTQTPTQIAPRTDTNLQTPTTTATPDLPKNTTQTSGGLYGGSLSIPTQTGVQTAQGTGIQTTTQTPQQWKSCSTPRWDQLKDKDFILAYEQRKDVATICNVQRRVCNNGTLEGTYTQNSCQENIQYEYTRTQVVSNNLKPVDPLIQPQPAPNDGASFSTNGKINETATATTTRWTSNTGNVVNTTGTAQTQNIKSDCRAPRGNIVKHGQFVKAYKSSIGLVDVPCETEIRLCVNGELKGKFLNKTCTVKNMTYNDYLAGNKDITKPTPQDIVDTLVPQSKPTTSFSFTNRIMSLFK